jgi:NitT/TauT family transport system substrate-binding protein
MQKFNRDRFGSSWAFLRNFNFKLRVKRRKFPLLLSILTLFCVIALNACLGSPQGELTPLRMGITPWPGFDIAIYGKEAGLFQQRGLDVEFVRFDNQQDSSRAVMRNQLDLAFASLWDVMQVDPTSDRPEFVMVTNVSQGSDGVVAKPGIESAKQLRGKKIGCKLGTVNHLILLEALQSNGIEPNAVEIADLPNEVAARQLKEGTIDAAVLWEPDLTAIAREIQGKVVFTTAEVDSLVIDGVIARSSFVVERERALQQFILAWFDIMNAVETQPDRVFELVGEQLGQTGESFAQDYSGLQKGDRDLNRRMFATNGRLQEAVAKIAELLKADPRHGKSVREDIQLNSTSVNAAIEAWES